MRSTAHHHVNLAPRYGIIISVIAIVFTIIFYLTKAYGNLWTGYFGNLIMFLGVLLSVIHYNSQHHEKTSMAALFAMGLRTTLWAVVITSAFNIIFHFIILNSTPGHGLENDYGTVEQSNSVDMIHNFWMYMLTTVLFTNGVVGLLAALIASMVFKRNQKTTRPE